jgi:hypothetical protein
MREESDEKRHIKIMKEWNREQKIGFAMFCIISIIGLTFGFRSFGAHLSRPFEIQIAKFAQSPRLILTDERNALEVERLKSSDTDGDGISDYEELYLYKTSPYLEDSDSDGFSDSIEISSGNDPNCPSGKECRTPSLVEASAPTSQIDPSSLAKEPDLVIPGLDLSGLESIEDIDDFFMTLGPGEIRSMLAAQGVPINMLDTLSDAEVTSMLVGAMELTKEDGSYDALIAESNTSGASNNINIDSASSLNSVNSAAELESLINSMTYDEIYALLINAGIPADLLEGLSEEDLREMLREAAYAAEEKIN